MFPNCYHFVQEELSRGEAEAYCRDEFRGEIAKFAEEKQKPVFEQLLRKRLHGLAQV